MTIYPRYIQKSIEENLDKGKVILIYGARRVGKTTLVKQILAGHPEGKYVNCDLLHIKTALETTNIEKLKDFIGSNKLIVLDEAQQITNIGMVLKVIIDTFPSLQIIATGSSSFDLADKFSESLTGRSRLYILMPLSLEEITKKFNRIEIEAKIENIMRFGLYPEVFEKPEQEAIEELQNITSNYLYKDILRLEIIKRPELILNLLRALSLQLGSECSMNEIAGLLGENSHTIKKYIEILERCFIIFRLPSFSRNLRKELGKRNKFYFYDTGVRNSLIMNYNSLELRNDTGALWENICILERLKYNHYHRKFMNSYFWRTYDQKEIDLVEEYGGQLHAFEFKWSPAKKVTPPKDFMITYPGSTFQVIDPGNFWNFIF